MTCRADEYSAEYTVVRTELRNKYYLEDEEDPRHQEEHSSKMAASVAPESGVPLRQLLITVTRKLRIIIDSLPGCDEDSSPVSEEALGRAGTILRQILSLHRENS